jgi:ribosome-associated protein
MHYVTRSISLDPGEIQESFVRSPGPGGQNVNKVATAVQLRFDVARSPSLPDRVRRRVMRMAGKRLTSDGVLIIESHRFRTQERNRTDALERLKALIRRGAAPQRKRVATTPSPASRERRLTDKRRRKITKQSRRPVSEHDE